MSKYLVMLACYTAWVQMTLFVNTLQYMLLRIQNTVHKLQSVVTNPMKFLVFQ